MIVVQESDFFSITSTLRGRLSFVKSLPLLEIKNAALGKKYQLGLNFIGDKRSHSLNLIHRNIDKPTDILSFPYDKESGEIFISLPYSRKKAKEFNREYENFIGFLFIHGVIHLKGYDHGSRMEHEEENLRKKFRI